MTRTLLFRLAFATVAGALLVRCADDEPSPFGHAVPTTAPVDASADIDSGPDVEAPSDSGADATPDAGADAAVLPAHCSMTRQGDDSLEWPCDCLFPPATSDTTLFKQYENSHHCINCLQAGVIGPDGGPPSDLLPCPTLEEFNDMFQGPAIGFKWDYGPVQFRYLGKDENPDWCVSMCCYASVSSPCVGGLPH